MLGVPSGVGVAGAACLLIGYFAALIPGSHPARATVGLALRQDDYLFPTDSGFAVLRRTGADTCWALL